MGKKQAKQVSFTELPVLSPNWYKRTALILLILIEIAVCAYIWLQPAARNEFSATPVAIQTNLAQKSDILSRVKSSGLTPLTQTEKNAIFSEISSPRAGARYSPEEREQIIKALNTPIWK